MLKNKTSVLFVNSDGRDRRTVQIPTFILLNWKKILIWSSGLFVILFSLVGFFLYEHTNEYYTTLYKERLARANQIKNAIDIEKAKESFQSIDQTMAEINQLMVQRGLKPLALSNAGGPLEFEITDINQVAEEYAENIQILEEMVSSTPFGLPHFGEQTSGFGKRNNPFGGSSVETHKGLDFRGDMYSPIQSTASGKVVYAGMKGGYGNVVIVEHPNKLQTLYAHLAEIHVKDGQKINVGEIIGKLGNTGRSTGPHLHYEIILKNEKIDPQNFINL
jgi:murein DD-endopeptidase MepM/ murein hydrolase activator NlpD